MTTESTKPFEGKTCFVITPIGGDNTDIRREADGIIDEVLIPVLEDELGFTVEVAHRVDTSGSITQQVIQSVIDSDFAICNLATLNPNVMYELALRHAARKPVVTIAPKGTSLPFDISDDRVVFYKNDIAGANQLKADLLPKTIAAMADETPDNPVYRAIKSGKVMQEVHAEGGANAAIFDAIDGLSKKVESLQKKSGRGAARMVRLSEDSIRVFKPDDEYFTPNEIKTLSELLNNLDTALNLNYSIGVSGAKHNVEITFMSNNGLNSSADFNLGVVKQAVIKELDRRGYLVL
jgi:hypothetical protein